MKLVARKVVNSLDKEIIVCCGDEYFHIRSEQVVNTSELKWISRTESQVKLLIKNDGWKSYIVKHDENAELKRKGSNNG